MAGFFRTHPYTKDRIAASMDEQRYLPEKDYYIINSSEFDRVKSRLLAIDNAQKAGTAAPTEQKKPTLKRRTSTEPGKEPGEEGKEQKKRPTLKRPGEPIPPDKPPSPFLKS